MMCYFITLFCNFLGRMFELWNKLCFLMVSYFRVNLIAREIVCFRSFSWCSLEERRLLLCALVQLCSCRGVRWDLWEQGYVDMNILAISSNFDFKFRSIHMQHGRRWQSICFPSKARELLFPSTDFTFLRIYFSAHWTEVYFLVCDVFQKERLQIWYLKSWLTNREFCS
jgi:hypothetical protein